MSSSARSKEDLYRKVADTLVEVLAVPREQIKPEARYFEDLGATSLDMATLLMLLEEDLGLMLPEHEARGLRTVAETVEFIMRRVS